MTLAMEQARLATLAGDAPFGCVVVDEAGTVVHSDHDRVQSLRDPSAHAEVNAIRALCQKLGTTKLDWLTFITTSEPCVTCLSLMIRCRVKRCVFGTRMESTAALPIPSEEIASRAYKHPIELVGGVMAEECLTQRTVLSAS